MLWAGSICKIEPHGLNWTANFELAWAVKCQTFRFNRGRLNQPNYRVLVLYQSPFKISYHRIFNLTLFMNGRKNIVNHFRRIIFPEGIGRLSWTSLFDHKQIVKKESTSIARIKTPFTFIFYFLLFP